MSVDVVCRTGQAVLPAVAVLVLGACGASETTTPKGPPPPPLQVVAGANITDTVTAQPAQALVVAVHNLDGSVRAGVTVRFEAQAGIDSLNRSYQAISVATLAGSTFSSLSTDQTDSAGRAKALLKFGMVAGAAKIIVNVPELGLQDTASFTVAPGNAARIIMRARDTALYVGGQYSIGAATADRFGNARPNDVLSFSALSSNVGVSAAGLVSAAAEGRASMAVSSGGAVDTARVSVVPHGTLAFLEGGPHVVAVMNLDGSGYKPLKSINDASVFPQWSPDGKSLVIYEGDPNSNARLTLVGLDSTVKIVMQIPNGALIGMAWPRFAPNGTIYIGGVTSNVGMQVWSVHADGTALQAIPGTVGMPDNFQHPSVSPDGATLIYDTDASTNGMAAVNLSTGAKTAVPGGGSYPVYSPDGSQIAYVGASGVFVADASGANARLIWNGSVQSYTAPAWSADGRYVLVPNFTLTLVRVSDLAVLPLPFLRNNFSQATLR